MNELLIYGSATHRNTGDLAMMHNLFRWLAAHVPESELILLTRNPDLSAETFPVACRHSHDTRLLAPVRGLPPGRLRVLARGAHFLLRWLAWNTMPRWMNRRLPTPLDELFPLLRRCRALVIHGSGSTNSIFWRGWLYPKAITALALHGCGIPVVITSQGLGPFDHPLDRLMARLLFRCASFIGVRDGETSAKTARVLGARPDTVYHTGDDALLEQEADAVAVRQALSTEGIPDRRPLIGVNVRDASSYRTGYAEGGEDAIAGALDRLAERTASHVVFIPITYDAPDDDRRSAERIAALMRHRERVVIVRGEYPPALLRGLIGRMDGCVGVSYHFLLFALAAGVPSLAITRNAYYRAKHEGLLSLFHCPEARVELARESADTLTDRIVALLDERTQRAEALRERWRALEAQAEAARSKLVDLLRSARPPSVKSTR